MGEVAKAGSPRRRPRGRWSARTAQSVPVSASWAFFESESGEVHGFVISFRSFEEIERIAEERKGRFPFQDIVGRTRGSGQIFDLVEVVKDTDSTVLITGESGTGKGLFARAIHELSPRRDKPFVKVNCAARHRDAAGVGDVRPREGSLTGAVADKGGAFEAAEGGTIFPRRDRRDLPGAAGELLRVIQDREFERVGSSRTQGVDVRVIAATNRDLKAGCAPAASGRPVYRST